MNDGRVFLAPVKLSVHAALSVPWEANNAEMCKNYDNIIFGECSLHLI